MASATSALHLSTVATAADLRPSSSSSAFNASASPNAAVSLCSRPVLPARFRRSSHRPVAIVPLSKGTVSKAPHHTRTFRCEAASSGDATSSSSSPPEAAPTATPAGGAKGHAFIHDFCFGITFGERLVSSRQVCCGGLTSINSRVLGQREPRVHPRLLLRHHSVN
ncbi:unnamed protein product [Closterium sp. NIES-53]